MATVVSVCYLALFLAVGLAAARRALPQEGAPVLVPLGCGFGVSLLALVPAALAVVLGFDTAAVLLSAVLVAALGIWLVRTGPRGRLEPDPNGAAMWACLVPVCLLTLALLYTHVLHLVDGAYHTGQSCYGDMAMHLGFIKNIAVTGKFPPDYPLLGGGHRFGYPFLCETVSSVFVVLGAGLKTAYLLPMLPAFLSVYGMAWQLACRLLNSAGKACLAFWLFFMGSGLGFVYFLDSAADFAGIFTGFYTTPTNYTSRNILWVNPIVDLLIPQRATLFGWSVLFPALYLLWRFCMEETPQLWLPLAALVLPLPLMHTHSALALVLICLVCAVYTLLRRCRTREVLLPWVLLAAVCGVVWLAQMWSTVFAQSLDGQNMLRLHFNWINGSDDGTLKDNYFWFYIKNIGLVYLLLLPAFFHAAPKQRWFYGGGLAILALAEVVVFQPNPYDNNKLLFVWHLLGCILVANLLVDWFGRFRSLPWRALGLTCCCFVAMFGSVLTVGRELLSDYTQWSADDIALAGYVDENAEPDALFLTSDSHLCPVFSLAGRRILCGSGSFVYYHGMDYTAEYYAMQKLYESPDEALLARWGIDYVLFDDTVYGRFPTANEPWYAARYPLWYKNGSCRVYRISR